MSSRNVRRGRRWNKKQYENIQERNEISENMNSMNDVEMEYRDKIDKKKFDGEHGDEWDNKQEMFDHRKKKERLKRELTDCKIEDINSVILNGENSCLPSSNILKKGLALKINSELSVGKSDVSNDKCNLREETLGESCSRKRKRDFCECDTHYSKFQGSGLTCIGILPGLKSVIESSDDSDQSCSSESEGNDNNKYDLLGRKIVCVAKTSSESK